MSLLRIARPTIVRRSLLTTSIRCKHTLPSLPYDYAALEPAISGRIMELHHSKHHQTYVNSLNSAEEKYAEAVSANDVRGQIALQPLLRFHGGGHINHTLFWENLAPKSSGGGEPPSGNLAGAITVTYGSVENLKKNMNASLAGIQGSGWSWLVRDNATGALQIIAMPNQDPVVGKYVPLLGIDAWEHAYYLQYENRKAEYFSAIWDVVNWKAAEARYKAAT
ncbi:putative Mn superoxide dismutase SodB [Tuber magnatum]|uniref:Superoxide dismutase n=1 Tax=Tuber magnatum TaxID=42249 RepID=A0A317SVX1_9PEZI|nr:putative Mn superoxide dismutase SodB [Tuber magnatum]